MDTLGILFRCFVPNDNYQFLMRYRVSANGKHELAQWFLHDTWDIELACKLITLGYPVQFEDIRKEGDRCLHVYDMDKFNKMEFAYDRALGIAKSSVQAFTIKEHDTRANWIEWAKDKGYDVAHLMPAETKLEAVPDSMRSISKGEVINAFDGFHFSRDRWDKNLGDPPDWLKTCRVEKGKQGNNKVSARWNPVLIAVALLDIDKDVTIKKLGAVFVILKDWREEWQKVSTSLSD